MTISHLKIVFILIALTGCSSDQKIELPEKISSSDLRVAKKLYNHYNHWQGVKYKEGGMSKKGVDCSGYVYLAYQTQFNKQIPRTTKILSDTGKEIDTDELKPGDLVFFKTGWKKRHIGIYVEQGKFMHASSSRGVMISKLNNPYWREAFWMARRL